MNTLDDRNLARAFTILGALLIGLSLGLIDHHPTAATGGILLGVVVVALCTSSAFREN